MEIFAHYTPRRASAVNSTRAGTIRVGGQPTPIIVNKGFTNDLVFTLHDNEQRAVKLSGMTISATLYNHTNVELFTTSLDIIAAAVEDGVGNVALQPSMLAPLHSGLYMLVLSYVDNHNNKYLIKQGNGLHRFAITLV